MILLDLSHTSHTRARTGVQRVARSLHLEMKAMGAGSVGAVTWDPYARTWRELAPTEAVSLNEENPSSDRSARWPWPLRIRGRVNRWLKRHPTPLAAVDGFIAAEIFSPAVAASLPEFFKKINGPKIALFHDAVALKLPELTPAKTVARFPAYLRELLLFDGVAAISEESRTALVEWWKFIGATDTPPVAAIPLGIDTPVKDTVLARVTAAPVLLSVGTLEGRKNHLALLNACETLWQQGHAFELRLIGLSQPQTGASALARLHALQAAGRPLRYDGAVDETMLKAAYHECAFTVYPSLMEGFGLPVLESISYGKPCICSARGALGESANGGGCLALPTVDASALASAIAWLLTKPEQRLHLGHAARLRTIKSWSTYTGDLLTWMDTLPSATFRV